MPGSLPRFNIGSILTAIGLSLLSCASQQQQIETTPARTQEPAESEISVPSAFSAPPPSLFKNGRELQLIRVMEGGACNAGDEGVRGLFLLYADPDAIERIKQEKGNRVFEQFEQEITDLSLQALQETIDVIHIADNPFALDVEDALQQIVEQIILKFSDYARPGIEKFKFDTDLAIDVIPFAESINFIVDDCNAVLNEPSEPS